MLAATSRNSPAISCSCLQHATALTSHTAPGRWQKPYAGLSWIAGTKAVPLLISDGCSETAASPQPDRSQREAGRIVHSFCCSTDRPSASHPDPHMAQPHPAQAAGCSSMENPEPALSRSTARYCAEPITLGESYYP